MGRDLGPIVLAANETPRVSKALECGYTMVPMAPHAAGAKEQLLAREVHNPTDPKRDIDSFSRSFLVVISPSVTNSPSPFILFVQTGQPSNVAHIWCQVSVARFRTIDANICQTQRVPV